MSCKDFFFLFYSDIIIDSIWFNVRKVDLRDFYSRWLFLFGEFSFLDVDVH